MKAETTNDLTRIELPVNGENTCHILKDSIPDHLTLDSDQFDELWNLHPEEHSTIMIHGKPVRVPRWDKSYERDYVFSGQKSHASGQPTPEILLQYLTWVQANVCDSANGIFVNWHDGSLGHYHGAHRDSTRGLVTGTPITTISFGEQRTLRMRPFPAKSPFVNFDFQDGQAIVIPWTTNQHWYHEIPKSKRNKGLRVSITIRSFG